MAATINQDILRRIWNAADELFASSESSNFPTVDAVRRRAQANMADTVAVMRDWRQEHSQGPERLRQEVPDRLLQASHVQLSTLWAEAQDAANENLKAAHVAWDAKWQAGEAEREELASAFDEQSNELEQARARAADLGARALAAEANLAVSLGRERIANQAVEIANGRAAEAADRIRDLHRELDFAHDQVEQARHHLTTVEANAAQDRQAADQALKALRGQMQELAEKAAELAREQVVLTTELQHRTSLCAQLSASLERQDVEARLAAERYEQLANGASTEARRQRVEFEAALQRERGLADAAARNLASAREELAALQSRFDVLSEQHERLMAHLAAPVQASATNPSTAPSTRRRKAGAKGSPA